MSTKISRFEDLIAWQKARALVCEVYSVSGEPHFSRDFALRDQIRRSAVSIPSNIAEGFERSGLREFQQYLSIAKGSCAELRTQLYIAFDVGYMPEPNLRELLEHAEEVGRIIGGLRKSVAEAARSSVAAPAPRSKKPRHAP